MKRFTPPPARHVLNLPSLNFCFLPIVIIAIFLLIPAQKVFAADITVDGNCSLRHAIRAANTDRAFGGCKAGNGADTITLTAAGTQSGTITLLKPLRKIESDITIKGGGFTISGAKKHRIFVINSGRKLRIENLTLSHGRTSGYGAAISTHSGEVVVRNSAFRNNNSNGDGGAIYTYSGNVDVRGSTFRNNSSNDDGGAIYNYEGNVVVRNSVFRNNSSNDGGGAINAHTGTIDVRGSTFKDNKAGGRNAEGGGGGAMSSYRGNVKVDDSVFKGNRAKSGAAIYSYEGSITVVNS